MSRASHSGGVSSSASGRLEDRAWGRGHQHGAERFAEGRLHPGSSLHGRHDPTYLSPISINTTQGHFDFDDEADRATALAGPMSAEEDALNRAKLALTISTPGRRRAPLSYGPVWRASRYPLMHPVHQVQKVGSSGAHPVATSSSVACASQDNLAYKSKGWRERTPPTSIEVGKSNPAALFSYPRPRPSQRDAEHGASPVTSPKGDDKEPPEVDGEASSPGSALANGEGTPKEVGWDPEQNEAAIARLSRDVKSIRELADSHERENADGKMAQKAIQDKLTGLEKRVNQSGNDIQALGALIGQSITELKAEMTAEMKVITGIQAEMQAVRQADQKELKEFMSRELKVLEAQVNGMRSQPRSDAFASSPASEAAESLATPTTEKLEMDPTSMEQCTPEAYKPYSEARAPSPEVTTESDPRTASSGPSTPTKFEKVKVDWDMLTDQGKMTLRAGPLEICDAREWLARVDEQPCAICVMEGTDRPVSHGLGLCPFAYALTYAAQEKWSAKFLKNRLARVAFRPRAGPDEPAHEPEERSTDGPDLADQAETVVSPMREQEARKESIDVKHGIGVPVRTPPSPSLIPLPGLADDLGLAGATLTPNPAPALADGHTGGPELISPSEGGANNNKKTSPGVRAYSQQCLAKRRPSKQRKAAAVRAQAVAGQNEKLASSSHPLPVCFVGNADPEEDADGEDTNTTVLMRPVADPLPPPSPQGLLKRAGLLNQLRELEAQAVAAAEAACLDAAAGGALSGVYVQAPQDSYERWLADARLASESASPVAWHADGDRPFGSEASGAGDAWFEEAAASQGVQMTCERDADGAAEVGGAPELRGDVPLAAAILGEEELDWLRECDFESPATNVPSLPAPPPLPPPPPPAPPADLEEPEERDELVLELNQPTYHHRVSGPPAPAPPASARPPLGFSEKVMRAAQQHIVRGVAEAGSETVEMACPLTTTIMPLARDRIGLAALECPSGGPPQDHALFVSFGPNANSGLLVAEVDGARGALLTPTVSSLELLHGYPFAPDGASHELLASLVEPTAVAPYANGARLLVFRVPSAQPQLNYVPYADWMARYSGELGPMRFQLRSLLFESSLSVGPSASYGDRSTALAPLPRNVVADKLQECTRHSSLLLNESLTAIRPVIDDTPGHHGAVYAFANQKALSEFTKWMGAMVRDQLLDRAAELTFLSAVASRHDRFMSVFGTALPEELSLGWGRHQVYPSECLFVYLRSDPSIRLDIGADKSLYNAMKSTDQTEVNLRQRSHRAIHTCTRPYKMVLVNTTTQCFACACSLTGLKPEVHHVTTVAAIHNSLVAPSLCPQLFKAEPYHHEFADGEVKQAVEEHLATPGNLVVLCERCHAQETAAGNREYAPPSVSSSGDTVVATAWWAVQTLSAKYGLPGVERGSTQN